MSIPKFKKDLLGEVAITPLDHFHAEYGQNTQVRCPRAVVMCFEKYIMDHFRTQEQSHSERFWSGELIWFEHTDVALIGNFGIGGPAACHVLEILIAKGLAEVIVVGHAGSLQPVHRSGSSVVIEKAVRDEGVSQHYLSDSFFVESSSRLTKQVAEVMETAKVPYAQGVSWTIDCMYRETREEIQYFASMGVDTVEMELASVFAVAAFRNIQAAGLLIVSDYVGAGNWDSTFQHGKVQSNTVWNTTLALEVLMR